MENTVPYTPITAPREASPATRFIHTSLAIQVSPSAIPVRIRSTTHIGTVGHQGMKASSTVPPQTPAMMERVNPRRAITEGYAGPMTITATRLTALTAPTTKFEWPARLNTTAISGDSKPKIRPTPRLVENTAASSSTRERAFMRLSHCRNRRCGPCLLCNKLA